MDKRKPKTDKELIEIYRTGLKEAYDEIYNLCERINDLENLLETMEIINPKEYEKHKKQYCKQFPEQNITVLVKELRERTGCGMMDCKRALQNCDYDIDKSVEWLKQHTDNRMI